MSQVKKKVYYGIDTRKVLSLNEIIAENGHLLMISRMGLVGYQKIHKRLKS